MWALDQQSTKERMEKGIEILTGTIFIVFLSFNSFFSLGVEMLTGTVLLLKSPLCTDLFIANMLGFRV